MKIARIHTRLLTATSLFIVLVIFSCKKETSGTLAPQDEEQANVSATESDAEAENVFDGVFNDVLGVNKDVALGGTGIFGLNGATGYEPSYSNGRIVSTTQCRARTASPSCLESPVLVGGPDRWRLPHGPLHKIPELPFLTFHRPRTETR